MWKYGGKKFYQEDEFLAAYYSDVMKKRKRSALFLPLADIHYRNKRYKLALDTVLAGLRAMPHYTSAHFLLGEIYYALEEFELAQEALEYVIKRKPDNLAALSLLAQVCLNKGKIKRASELYQQLVHMNPHDANALEILQHLPEAEGEAEENANHAGMAFIKSGLVVLDEKVKELIRIGDMVIAGDKPDIEESIPLLTEEALKEIFQMREAEEAGQRNREKEDIEEAALLKKKQQAEISDDEAHIVKTLEGYLERLDAPQA